MKEITKYTKTQKYTQDFYDKNREQQQNGTPASNISDDSLRYEVDTQVLLEETYNNWLGKSKLNGEWMDDPFKKPMMSKELADKLIQSIRLKVNTHSLLSYYDNELINKIAYTTAKVWNEALMFETMNYKLSSNDYKVLIRVDIPFLIQQLLLQAYKGISSDNRTKSRSINVIKREDSQGGL